MADKENIVTIDGPAGVGKSTISRKVAAALGYTYLDTGAMYRGVALYLDRLQIDIGAEHEVEAALDKMVIELLPAKNDNSDVGILISGEDASPFIRSPEMSMAASAVSKLATVRKKLTLMQQEIGSKGRVVAEGRDTGTVVFPQAEHKFFLDARPEVRARRRMLQLQEKGEKVNEREILALTIERDRNDRERSLAPLRPAEDAILVDTSDLEVEEVIKKVLAAIYEKD